MAEAISNQCEKEKPMVENMTRTPKSATQESPKFSKNKILIATQNPP